MSYASLLSSLSPKAAESHAPYTYLTERHLQVMWYEQKYFKNLTTSIGEPIQVISPGIWNAESGPDFQKAHLLIGNKEIRGDIEIDLMDENWVHHKHHQDSRYHQVILHISFWKPNKQKPLVTAEGKQLITTYLEPFITISPTRIISLIDLDLYPYKQFLGSGKCAQALFKHLSEEEIRRFFRQSSEWRLSKKQLYLASRFDEEPLQFAGGIAMALGYKQNTEPFLDLFQTLYPLKNLSEANLFSLALGSCGFFQETFRKKWQDSSFYQSLLSLWQEKSSLLQRRIALRLSHIRPLNHPVRRLFILAKLISDPYLTHYFVRLTSLWDHSWQGNKKWSELRRTLTNLIPSYQDPYWNTHFLFELQEQKKPLSLIGEDLKKQILINTFLPLLYHKIVIRENPEEKKAFLSFYASFNEAENSKTRYLAHRFFGDSEKRILLRKSQHAQGAYQLHKDFCIHFEASCVGCPFVDRFKRLFLECGDLSPPSKI